MRRESALRPATEPSMSEAIGQVASSTRGVVEERIELLKLELRVAARRWAEGGVLLAVAAVVAIGAWWGLMAALVAWLTAALSLAAALAVVAAANALLAGVLAWRGAANVREPLPPPEAGP